MIEHQQGKIINISSGAGLAAVHNNLAYVASKHAVIGLTRGLAVEWAKYNIRVNCICPSFTVTPLTKNAQAKEQGFLSKRAQRSPLGRLAVPDDHARAAVYLASDESEYITGIVMPVDGGMSALYSGYISN
jgi:NAD(P)-dependent dehydrogenase (short-subunit alcohol dehydrogenase family)